MKLSLILLPFLVFGALVACDIQFTDDHFPVSSDDSSMSKENGVFIGEYFVDSNFILNPSNRKFMIKEVFVEKQYRKRHSGKIELIGGEQVVIVLQDTIDKEFNLKWELRSDKGMHFTSKSPNELQSDLKSNPIDSIILEVYDVTNSSKQKMKFSNRFILNIPDSSKINDSRNNETIQLILSD